MSTDPRDTLARIDSLFTAMQTPAYESVNALRQVVHNGKQRAVAAGILLDKYAKLAQLRLAAQKAAAEIAAQDRDEPLTLEEQVDSLSADDLADLVAMLKAAERTKRAEERREGLH